MFISGKELSLQYEECKSSLLAVPVDSRSDGGEIAICRVSSGPVILSAFFSALHSLIWIIITEFANDMKLGGIAKMLKDRVRIEYNLDRLEKWFGRKVEWHHVRKCAVS